jgi:hypothetical protein
MNGYRGYHQLRIALEDQLKTIFTTPWDTFCYTVMPFGLYNVPGTFQRFINKVLESYLGHFVRVFMDDFVIYRSRIDHLKNLEKLFQRLDETRIILSPEKTMIVVILGRMVEHIISKDDIAIDPKKIKVIERISFPETKQVVKVFLGAIGYYQCYVLRYTMISKPFARFLKKDAPPPH